jgi:nucleotide-binding universal stress UspA family protein
MYKHILVAVGTSLSQSALSTAIARARECDARLTALHVVDRTPWWAVVTGDCNVRDTAALIDDHARALTRYSLRQIESAGIDGTGVSVTLPPGLTVGEAIAKAANEAGADLIVLGGETDSGWGRGRERLRDVVCTQTRCDVLIAAHRARDAHTDIERETGNARAMEAASAARV